MRCTFTPLLLFTVVEMVPSKLNDPTWPSRIWILLGSPLDLRETRLLTSLLLFLIAVFQILLVPSSKIIVVHLLDPSDMEIHTIFVRKFLWGFLHQQGISIERLLDRFEQFQAK